MCHRMSPLLFSELEEALRELRASGRARVPQRDAGTNVPDAYPGSQVPLFVLDDDGNLMPTTLTWGFPTLRDGRKRLVFNTRIETALSQAQSGEGLWADPIRYGRCLVPVRGFYEHWTQPPKPEAWAHQNPDQGQPQDGQHAPQVRFGLAGHGIFLMACIRNEDRFSVVTTRPNAEVAPVHNRMPLVLGPGESYVWLGPEYASLQDRSAIRLTSEVEA